jgi:hypothetical protein
MLAIKGIINGSLKIITNMLKNSGIKAAFLIKDSIKVYNYILRFFVTLKFTCKKRYINK